MANPTIAPDQLPRRKPIGEDLNTHDSLLPVIPTNIHKTTPPSLADGDVSVDQADDMGNKKVTLGDPAQIADLKNVAITSATIEQTTGATHNDLNIAVAGKDTAGKVQPIATDTSGHPLVTEASASAIKTAVELIDNLVTDTVLISRNIDVDESGDVQVAAACKLYGYYCSNKAATAMYLKLYNKATAPTVGTDTPVCTYYLPAGAAANISFTRGINFATGLGVGATTGVADADTGAPAANDIIVNLYYV